MEHTLPVVVHRYVNRCTTVAQPPGFADFLKGTVYLYQQSKRGTHPPSFALVVDFSQHPMGVFIESPHALPPSQGRYRSPSTPPLTECFNQYRPVIQNIVATLHHNPETSPPVTYAICHEPYDKFDSNESVLEPDDQAYMRSVLQFTPELTDMADNVVDDLNLTSEYAVIHLRMGDHQSADSSAHAESLAEVEEFLERVVIPTWGSRILILSDSYYTKKYLKTKYGLNCTDFTPVHMGETQRFLRRGEPATLTDIGHTLVEFILMSRSQTIYIYSVYGWCSGFSKLAAHIYGIPYINMQRRIQT